MALGIEAQVLQALGPRLEAVGETDPPPIGDVETRRANGRRWFDYIASTSEPAAHVRLDRHTLTTPAGAPLDLYWYHPVGEHPGSAALFLHGGGMILGLEHARRAYDLAVRDYVA